MGAQSHGYEINFYSRATEVRERNGNSAFSIMRLPIINNTKFRIPYIIISFKKYLKTIHGQSVLEYSLLLIVIAALSLAIIWPHVGSNGPNNFFRNITDEINQKITGSP